MRLIENLGEIGDGAGRSRHWMPEGFGRCYRHMPGAADDRPRKRTHPTLMRDQYPGVFGPSWRIDAK